MIMNRINIRDLLSTHFVAARSNCGISTKAAASRHTLGIKTKNTAYSPISPLLVEKLVHLIINTDKSRVYDSDENAQPNRVALVLCFVPISFYSG